MAGRKPQSESASDDYEASADVTAMSPEDTVPGETGAEASPPAEHLPQEDGTVAEHLDIAPTAVPSAGLPAGDGMVLSGTGSNARPIAAGEEEAVRRAYKSARKWAWVLFGTAGLIVSSFFVFVLFTAPDSFWKSVSDGSGVRGDNLLILIGIAGGVLAAAVLVYLTVNSADLVERNAITAARHARRRFQEREHVLSNAES
jgi:hypothetical protein